MNPLYAKSYSDNLRHGIYASFRNALRVRKFTAFISPHLGERILEIGCSDGALLRNLRKKGADIAGLDVNIHALDSIEDFPIYKRSATNIDLPRESFEKVCAFEVLEHIEDTEKVLQNVFRILVPGGKFYLSVPVEFVRGQNAWYDALRVYGSIKYARKLHVHKLNPIKIGKNARDVGFTVSHSSIEWIPFPSYVMILQKG